MRVQVLVSVLACLIPWVGPDGADLRLASGSSLLAAAIALWLTMPGAALKPEGLSVGDSVMLLGVLCCVLVVLESAMVRAFFKGFAPKAERRRPGL